MPCIRGTTKINRGKGYLDSGSPFFPYAHSGSISSRAVSPLLIVRRASSHWKRRVIVDDVRWREVSRRNWRWGSSGITYSSDDPAQANFEAQGFSLLFLSCRCRTRTVKSLQVGFATTEEKEHFGTRLWLFWVEYNCKSSSSVIPVGMLVSKTVPSSREPVYQQLTVSPFFGKLVLSPFFNTDLVYFGGP